MSKLQVWSFIIGCQIHWGDIDIHMECQFMAITFVQSHIDENDTD